MFLIFAFVVYTVAAAAAVEDGAQMDRTNTLNQYDNCWWACGERGGYCDACPEKMPINGGTPLRGRCCRIGWRDRGCAYESPTGYADGCLWYHCCVWCLMGKFLIAKDQSSVSVDIKSREFGTFFKHPWYTGFSRWSGHSRNTFRKWPNFCSFSMFQILNSFTFDNCKGSVNQLIWLLQTSSVIVTPSGQVKCHCKQIFAYSDRFW